MLIAHGRPGDSFHQRLFQLLGKRTPRVAYVGAANGDDEAWHEEIAGKMRRHHGATVEFARMMSDGEGPRARAIIEGADLVYLAGGDVSLLARRITALELGELLRQRHAAGVMMAGVSAGAIGLGRYWIEFPDGAPTYRLPCAGIVDFALDCHDEESDWEELRALLERWGADDPAAVVEAYGIPMNGALEVDSEGRVSSRGVAPKRLRLDGGRIIE